MVLANAISPINKVDKDTIKLITDSVEALADESGWEFFDNLGNFILKKKPDFDPRNYGVSKLLSLIKSIQNFEINERIAGVGNIRHFYKILQFSYSEKFLQTIERGQS